MSRAPAAVFREPVPRPVFVAALVWALGVMVAVHLLDFPGSLVDFTRASGGGELLDLRPSFSEHQIYQRLEAYGPTGRENYAFRNRSVDILLPLSLLPLLYLLMRLALQQLPAGRGLRVLLLGLPLAYVVFDLAENAAVLVLLAHFPEPMPLAAALLPVLTTIKRTAVMLALAVPFAVFGVASLRSALSAP